MRWKWNALEKMLEYYLDFRNYGDEAIVCRSIPNALELIAGMQNEVERVWVIGGSRVYKVFCINCM